MSDRPTDRASAIALLREFNKRLDAKPGYAERARAMPLPRLLENMRGVVPDETLDAVERAVTEHHITWEDLLVADVYAATAQMLVGAIRRSP